ncbi:DUF4097 family beta strand repeat-containing protein [Streptomyces sp. NPDC006553]|uniref:DUF4097 family beta strand repeat-containing protein n=1 Tax=unclassified Streptomyces TaxID=2593676 RepID=UPI0022591362|nr:DUF4097 family beta strand repeat-containing protein [Streptomyces sp. NBC_00233]MCX5231841.1 DUF4097 domain-containing protein [Streptomyces sp. NBC_00233]
MQNFDTPAAIVTLLAVPAGRIRLVAAERADTTVEIRPADASESRDVKTAEQTEVTYTDGVLRIEVPKPKNGDTFGNTGSIEVTVQLPAGSRVEAEAAATELRAVGRLGDVAFQGAYQQIRIAEAASLTLTATDGDIEVGRLTGSAEITTARGDIRIAEAAGGTLALTTQKGDITVGAATGVSAVLDAGTAYGRVTNSLKNDGTPGLSIRATTAYGDIAARSL